MGLFIIVNSSGWSIARGKNNSDKAYLSMLVTTKGFVMDILYEYELFTLGLYA